MLPALPDLLRGAAKLAVVILASVSVGFGIGAGLSAVSGDGDSSATPSRLAPGTTTSSATATVPGPPASPTNLEATTTDIDPSTEVAVPPAPPTVRFLVNGVTLVRAETAAGRAENHAWLLVGFRVRNPTDAPVELGRVTLVFGEDRVANDRNATEEAGGLFEPILPRHSAGGDLRFETKGAATNRLQAATTARLEIGDRTVEVRIAP